VDVDEDKADNSRSDAQDTVVHHELSSGGEEDEDMWIKGMALRHPGKHSALRYEGAR